MARFAHAAFGWKIAKFLKFGGRKWDSGGVLSELVSQICVRLFSPLTYIYIFLHSTRYICCFFNRTDKREPVFQCNSGSFDPQRWHYVSHSSSHFARVSQRLSVFVTLSLENSCLPLSEIYISLFNILNNNFIIYKLKEIPNKPCGGHRVSFCDICRKLIYLLAASAV